MADFYLRVNTYEQWKEFEQACRDFKETTHGEGTDYYHKSVRLPFGEGNTLEVHGPLVMARVRAEEQQSE